MSHVFISYRQTDNEQRQRVRDFAERLKNCAIDVLLDQFVLADKAAGPNWPKWCSDRATETENILIVGTQAWFQCFEQKQKPGTGLGAAYEANIIRQRIYEAGAVIDNIRVVLFDDAEVPNISLELRGYHHFHAERDFADIVRWLGGTMPVAVTPRTSIPHNLPSLQPFFGREEELRKIADALDPESRIWGALIDGPGGMGKTSLAVRAAYDAPPDAFDRIAFVSLKSRELDDDGVRDLSSFLISGLAELLNELARELGHAEIAKAAEDQRPRLLLDMLRGTRTLLILDNLESLLKRERDIVVSFVNRLPPGCRAILTARGRIGGGGKEIILNKLSRKAALEALGELAKSNPWLAHTSEAERLALYEHTDGKPLLLLWTADQLGRGHCVSVADAIAYLRSCPEGNDPLEFIFGDLVEDFSEAEASVLCALTFFTLPAKVEHLMEVAECPEANVDHALRGLINRSLIVPSEELKTFTLVPLVADFLRKKKPEVVIEMGDRLEKRAYALVVENGYQRHDRFPVLDAAWPIVAAALPRFLAGENNRLQTVCGALFQPLNFSGRFDEALAFDTDAETRARSSEDFRNAGWRAYEVGWIHYQRGQAPELLACAARAESHWQKVESSPRELAAASSLRGIGHKLAKDFVAATSAYREAVELLRTVSPDSEDIATTLNDLADAERLSGELDAAERDYREALRIAAAVDHREAIAYITCNLAVLARDRDDWIGMENHARDAFLLCVEVGRLELIAGACHLLAVALSQQAKKVEAHQYAERAVNIFAQLGSGRLADALETLAQCES